jgi:poly-D-alanine transfer protein DltD
MVQVDIESFWKGYDESSDLLQHALNKLVERGEQREWNEEGISSDFSQEAAMKLMEGAMESLSTEYIQNLENFKASSDPMEVLSMLEESETIWRRQAKVINTFDPNGQEGEFLTQIRELTCGICVDKLEEVSESAAQDATNERIACCLGLMAVIDHIWAEQGRPIVDPERQRFREIAGSFR